MDLAAFDPRPSAGHHRSCSASRRRFRRGVRGRPRQPWRAPRRRAHRADQRRSRGGRRGAACCRASTRSTRTAMPFDESRPEQPPPTRSRRPCATAVPRMPGGRARRGATSEPGRQSRAHTPRFRRHRRGKQALVRAADEAARTCGSHGRPSYRRLRRHETAVCSSPIRSASWWPTTARARGSSGPSCGASRRGHPDRPRDGGRQRRPGTSSTRPTARSPGPEVAAEQGAGACWTRVRRPWAPWRWCWPTGSAARCFTRRAATVSRPTPWPRAPASTRVSSARWWPRPWFMPLRRRGRLVNGWGSQAFDDEGVPHSEDTGHCRRSPYRLSLRPPARPRGRGPSLTGNGRRQSTLAMCPYRA